MKAISDEVKKYRDARKWLSPFVDMALNHETIGQENIPSRGALILVANHRSDLDPLIISAHVPRFLVWIAANYTFKIPLIGKFLEQLGTIPISAKKTDQIRAFKQVFKVMKNERVLGIFPEGHDYILENDFSKRMTTFHNGFARFSLKFKKPVLPTAVIAIEEKKGPIPVPSFIRDLLGFPEEVLKIKTRLNYKNVRIVFGKPIAPDEYLAMGMEEGITALTIKTKEEIDRLIREHAPVERRSERGGRASGTRVRPDEGNSLYGKKL